MQVTNVNIDELKENDKNPRRITKKELQKLTRSIKEFGFVDPIIVNKHKTRNNIVVGGHQRLKAAKQLGMKEVPVTYVDIPEDKESLLNIALNEIGGEWDDDKLLSLLTELDEKGIDLTVSGFDESLLDEILSNKEQAKKESTIDKTPKTPEKPKSKTGEVWILGDHRLMCGDSTNPEDFKTLMKDKIADLCWTDPPYGVSYVGAQIKDSKEWDGLQNDELRDNELKEFLKRIYTNVHYHTKKNAPIYTCYASINHMIFEQALMKAGFTVKQMLIWEKGHVLGHSDYHWTHEPILYCRKDDQPSWYGDRTHKTVIMNSTVEDLETLKKEDLINLISQIRMNSDFMSEKKDPSSEYIHSTQKPVSLSKRMIKNSSRPNDIVIEPCAGSGSTLMACESSGRKCYSMEIDPKYVDVILTRWSDYTDKTPIRESDGKKWSELQ